MKIAPIVEEMAKRPERFQQVLMHTGQHYDDEMSQVFFDDLDLPRPDVYLGVGSGSHAQQTARVMLAFELVLREALEARTDDRRIAAELPGVKHWCVSTPAGSHAGGARG
jgi:UDP-N-acetylglucosamine 2-epimerase